MSRLISCKAKLEPYRVNEIEHAECYYMPGMIDRLLGVEDDDGIEDDDASDEGGGVAALASTMIFQRMVEEMPWAQGSVTVFGSEYDERRLTCLLVDNPSLHPTGYTYSGKTMYGVAFPDYLVTMREAIETSLFQNLFHFDTCLVNYYRNGNDVIGAHSDAENDLLPGAPIVSVSLGASRFFDITSRPSIPPTEKVRLILSNGDVLIMWDEMQKYYKHGIPVQKKVTEARINLTMRVTVRD